MSDLYAIYAESGCGSLDGSVIETWTDLAEAREAAADLVTHPHFAFADLAIYRMERVGDDDDA